MIKKILLGLSALIIIAGLGFYLSVEYRQQISSFQGKYNFSEGVADLTPEEERYVINNMVSTLYHELGHGLIHQLDLPVLGREEDAADSLSVVLINNIYEDDKAVEILTDVANDYLVYSQNSDSDENYWDEHSSGSQRTFNFACWLYGAAPEQRSFLLEKFNLPEERAVSCAEEFSKDEDSWFRLLKEHGGPREERTNWAHLGKVNTPTKIDKKIVAAFEEAANTLNDLNLPAANIPVNYDYCNTPNAFYLQKSRSVTMCIEMTHQTALSARYLSKQNAAAK